MGVLAPLFLAGLTALAVPLVFHLVRRTPRGRTEFSSLMFLGPTPPRLTRRSRLDQILLLLLRLGMLALLTMAFTRPFLRETSLLSLSDLPRRRVALLVDVSASMRRGDVWQQALREAERELDELGPHDEVALYAFSDRIETIVAFPTEVPVRGEGDESAGAASTESSSAADASAANASSTARTMTVAGGPVGVAAVRQALRRLSPTWNATDLGTALVAVAGELDASHDVAQSLAEQRLVVVSDFQKGSRLDALQGFEWPERIRVVARSVLPAKPSNATARLLAADPDAEGDELRVRVANANDSQQDQFFVRWSGGQGESGRADGASRENETAVYVPPGESRVVRLPRGDQQLSADRLQLRGDEEDFDNLFFAVPPTPRQIGVLYGGDDSVDDPRGHAYFLRSAIAGDPLRKVDWQMVSGDNTQLLAATPPPRLVVWTTTISEVWQSALQQFVERGGTLLVVPKQDEAASALTAFFPEVRVGAAEPKRDANPFLLLGEIDFSHPWFAPLSGPRYNDFTKIHFWKHRPVTLVSASGTTNANSVPSETSASTAESTANSATRVVARFDNGEPWMLERALGNGRVLGLTSGWNPDDSQLAVSSKFVVIVGHLLDQASGARETAASLVVHEPLTLPASRQKKVVVHTPDGQTLGIAAQDERGQPAVFRDTEQPGVYSVELDSESYRFAVNLAASESETTPIPLDMLEQLGVRMGTGTTKAERLNRMRQERDVELEGRQKVWRWLLVGCLGLLMVETWWAARAARLGQATKEALT